MLLIVSVSCYFQVPVLPYFTRVIMIGLLLPTQCYNSENFAWFEHVDVDCLIIINSWAFKSPTAMVINSSKQINFCNWPRKSVAVTPWDAGRIKGTIIIRTPIMIYFCLCYNHVAFCALVTSQTKRQIQSHIHTVYLIFSITITKSRSASKILEEIYITMKMFTERNKNSQIEDTVCNSHKF